MSAHASDAPSFVERLFNNRRVVIGALSFGALVIVGSLALGTYGGPRSAKVATIENTTPVNVPIMRQLPRPEPRKGDAIQQNTFTARAR